MVFWSCSTCSRSERFSARRREPSVSRLRIRIDCSEFVLITYRERPSPSFHVCAATYFASSRFWRRYRRLTVLHVSGDV